jgi:hypothetical protein
MEDPSAAPPPIAAQSTAVPPLPWEDPSTGMVEGLFTTAQLFILEPREAFSRLSAAGIGRPFLYALIMAWVELVAGFAYWLLIQTPFFLTAIPQLEDELAEAALGAGMILLIGGVVFVLMPVFLAIGLFLHTCILHLMLLILGEGKGGFETTFRTICYSHTADLANVIPLCGGIVSLVWFIVLQIIGVAEAHRCSYGKATLAIFLPILLCCACGALLISLGVGAGILGALAEQ